MYMKKHEFTFEHNGLIPKLDTWAETRRLSAKAMELTSSKWVYVQYVSTVVFKQINNVITLNTNGWYTNTSKKWINDYLPSGMYVQQYQGAWYVVKTLNLITGKKDLKTKLENGEVVEFRDNMTIKI